MKTIEINGRKIGEGYPTYFIADIAANHDGNLDQAKKLIELAKLAGADAAKFQHFRAHKIVSKEGFEMMNQQLSHQAKWKKSVYEVYEAASLPWEWTEPLATHAKKVGIDFFSAPYDIEAVDMLEPYVPAYKIGSGDITWLEIIEHIATKEKPVLLATGASTSEEVKAAVHTILKKNAQLILMQCNTNYTASLENFKYINLNVLKTYQSLFPQVILGLSDHTPGHATVLGAVALGARVIEKHFTDDNDREGPDHKFSMTPHSWKEMVDRTRELEAALGDGIKKIETNEQETAIVQRRGLRAAFDLERGSILTKELIDVLRPATPGILYPTKVEDLIGVKLEKSLKKGDALTESLLPKIPQIS